MYDALALFTLLVKWRFHAPFLRFFLYIEFKEVGGQFQYASDPPLKVVSKPRRETGQCLCEWAGHCCVARHSSHASFLCHAGLLYKMPHWNS